MTRIAFALLLALIAGSIYADKPQAPNNVAHGAEKVGAEATHPNEGESGPEGAPKFLGLPAWIWKTVNMLGFLALLGWLLGGPVKGALASRSQQIHHESEEARERRAKADQMAADIQRRLAQLEDEVRTIRERAQTEGERQRREMIAAAEAEANKIMQSARNEVDNRLKNVRHELTEFAAQLASERAEQLLREKINDADRDKLFRDSLSELEGASS